MRYCHHLDELPLGKIAVDHSVWWEITSRSWFKPYSGTMRPLSGKAWSRSTADRTRSTSACACAGESRAT